MAREAGVSLATASRTLNGSTRRVNDEYRDRVRAAAARLNYSANLSAQAVARGRSKSIGLVVGDIADPYFSSIAAGVFRAAEEAGLIVTVAASERRPEHEINIVAALRGQKPQVLLLAGSRIVDEAITLRLVDELKAFERDGGRVALISQEGLPFDTVTLQNEDGARRLARRMVELGYTRFAVLAGPRNLLTARDRLKGIRAGLAELGIDLPGGNVIHGEFTRDGGYAAAGEFLSLYTDAEIILAVNDVMAVGAMARLRESNLSLPGDVAVAGFDDIATLRDVTPSLTTFRLPLESLGSIAVALALDPDAPGPRLRTVDGDVVVRQSTPPRV
ncbi:MAG TPA: LacI family DNA-binding transcriptional regulator [Microbacteriaceae bacterium]